MAKILSFPKAREPQNEWTEGVKMTDVLIRLYGLASEGKEKKDNAKAD